MTSPGRPQRGNRAAADRGARYACRECRALYRSAYRCCPIDGSGLEPISDDPLEGCTIAGRYILEACIGEGAMGRVYRARHRHLSRRFALKILFGDVAADDTMRQRFAREAEVASCLDHPNVVSTVDFGESRAGLLYIAMDHVSGTNLAELIRDDGPLPARRAVALARQIASGLEHAHAHALVHRDLKPLNVIVEAAPVGERARILDFGVALSEADATAARLTNVGTVIGTPAYMAPEQSCGQAVDGRADLFSLGVTLYEMLAGAPPFDGTALEVVRKNAFDPPPPLARRAPQVEGVPAELEALVARLLAKSPDARVQTAGEVARALDALDPEALSAEPAPSRSPALAPRRSSEWDALATVDLPGRKRPRRDARALVRWTGRRAQSVGLAATMSVALAVLQVDCPAATTAVQDAGRAGIGPIDAGPAQEPTRLARGAAAHAALRPLRELAVPEPEGDATATEREPEPAEPRAREREPERDGAASRAELTRRYRRLAASLDRLYRQREGRVAAAYRDRFFAIPYSRALRVPSVRARALAAIDELAEDVESAAAIARSDERPADGR